MPRRTSRVRSSQIRRPFEALESRRFFAAHVLGDPTVYQTIQAAVNAALPGGIVTVDPGVYAEQVTVNKKLIVQGARAGVDARSNSRGVGESIVVGQTDATGKITGGFKIAVNDVTLDGFTVQGQTTLTDTDGAGIVIRPNINGTKIFNNIVQNNVAGLYLANNSTTNPTVIQYNLFRSNNNDGDHSGRGIYTNGGLTGGNLVNVTIDSNAFLYNMGSPATTTTVEAAISLQTLAENAQSDIRITNNIFDQGGKAVLFFNVSNSLIAGNTITYMRDQWSGALRFEGGDSNITIRDNTLYGNTGPAIRIDNKAVPGTNFGFVINRNNFYGNGYNTAKEALVVNGDQYDGPLDARNNWWNSASGPSGSFTGSGEQVQANGHDINVSGWATSIIPRPLLGYLGVNQMTESTIQFEEFDHGGRGIAYNDDSTRAGNNKYRQPQTVDISTTNDTGGGVHVMTVKAGEWLQYSINVLTSGIYDFAARVANGVAGGKFRVEIDGANATGAIAVPNTGASTTWATIVKSGLNLTAGNHILRIVFEADGGNFNWFKLTNITPVLTPAAPTGLVASAASFSAVNLAWQDKSNNETGFIIERKTGAGAWEIITTTPAGATTYTDAGLSQSTAYTYRVRAKNDSGESANSNESAVTTPEQQTVFYLSDLTWIGTPVNGWGPVERDQSVGGANENDGTAITLNGVVYAKGLGAHANSEIIFNLNGQYGAFLSDVGVDDRQTTNGSVSFQVFADGVKIFDSGLMLANSPTQSINVSVAGVQQLKLIVTDGGDGTSFDHADWAGARLVLAPAAPPTAPATPTGLGTSVASATQINLTWTDVATETSYRIERSIDNINFTSIGTTSAGVTAYSDATASASTQYYYRIVAVNNVGDSAPSDSASATTPALPTPPLAPSGLVASAVSESKIDLTWLDNSDSETGFIIERSLNGIDGWTQIATPAAGTTSYSDSTGLSASTQYFYRVRATNTAGASADSNVADATTSTPVPTVPAAPTGLAASATNFTQLNLTWTDNAVDETGYIVERSTDGTNFTQVATLAANSNSFSDPNLAAGTKFYYRVRAMNDVGPSLDSNIASASTVAANGLPAGWASGDIGAVGVAGSTTLSNGVYTVKGAGTDIWGNADSFHYAYRQVTGDATIIVRVTSVQNTDLLAKAGLMFRDSLAPNAKEVGLFVTPGGGLRLMRRTATGGSTTASSVAGPKAPYWLKLVRAGGTITAYSSTNGATWTTVGSVSVSMNSTIYVGMAVTSKKTTATATATFDNLSVT
jgi:regulation of enolase protein 1 (concanavalin A-like superfamily)